MKSKAPLVMMEQIIMVLVFALAAALCLQTFVLSGKISQKTEIKNRAVVEAQNVAETMKSRGINGLLEYYVSEQSGDPWKSYFTEAWEITKEESKAEYILTISFAKSQSFPIWHAEVIIMAEGGEELVRLPVAGQTEVMQNE